MVAGMNDSPGPETSAKLDVVKKWLKAEEDGQFDTWKDLCAEEYKMYFPSGAGTPVTRNDQAQQVEEIVAALPDLKHEVKELFAAGDRVVLRAVNSGTHTGGPLFGIPPTGKNIEYSVIAVLKVQNGKIVENRVEMDALGLMQQLGMKLAPAEAP